MVLVMMWVLARGVGFSASMPMILSHRSWKSQPRGCGTCRCPCCIRPRSASSLSLCRCRYCSSVIVPSCCVVALLDSWGVGDSACGPRGYARRPDSLDRASRVQVRCSAAFRTCSNSRRSGPSRCSSGAGALQCVHSRHIQVEAFSLSFRVVTLADSWVLSLGLR
jgi:hypothetical protein